MNKRYEELTHQFKEAINMSPRRLETWLSSTKIDLPRQLPGQRVLEILRKKKGDYRKSDYNFMKKAVNTIHRRLTHRPSTKELITSWRTSLMLWGRDPMK